jgi:cob(I)alamin adenosyltransferase
MSIVTKTGDQGETSLMFNRRVPKSHPRVEALGHVDELNAALGWARAWAALPLVREALLAIQQDLILLMGELATLEEDLARYRQAGFTAVTNDHVTKLDRMVHELEGRAVSFDGWATPGANPSAAALDLARTVCRRAERRVAALQEAGDLRHSNVPVYLNRLSDVLWLLARWAESESNPRP